MSAVGGACLASASGQIQGGSFPAHQLRAGAVAEHVVPEAGGAHRGAAAGFAVGRAGAADGQSARVCEGAGGARGGVGQALVGAVVEVGVGGDAVEAAGGVQAGGAGTHAGLAFLRCVVEELALRAVRFQACVVEEIVTCLASKTSCLIIVGTF